MAEEKHSWVKHLAGCCEEARAASLRVHMSRDFMKLALGDNPSKGSGWGETMAFLDYERLGLDLASGAIIIESLRFVRANPKQFETFVQENREAYDIAVLGKVFEA